jgi:hypothetical protein
VYDRGNSGVPEEKDCKKRQIMARFRCKNEEIEKKYWMGGEERRCRMCYEKKETIEHRWNGCSDMREGEKGTGRNSE